MVNKEKESLACAKSGQIGCRVYSDTQRPMKIYNPLLIFQH